MNPEVADNIPPGFNYQIYLLFYLSMDVIA